MSCAHKVLILKRLASFEEGPVIYYCKECLADIYIERSHVIDTPKIKHNEIPWRSPFGHY